jgi:uncharacterized protein (DUF2384 family)
MPPRASPVPAAGQRPDPAHVLTKAVLRSASLLGASGADLARILGVSEATVSRMRRGTATLEPQSKEAELAALLVRCFRALDVLVGGNDMQRRAWMLAYNRALNGAPADLVKTAQGLVTTVAYLDRMRAPS